jgi:DNA/RNA-binding domain of Phe-tRNA-synthetase-like protein
MNMLKRRLDATDAKLQEIKTARKSAVKAQRQQVKQTRADRERKIVLAGEALLRRVDRGEWDVGDFHAMMDEFLFRPVDRALFDLNDE